MRLFWLTPLATIFLGCSSDEPACHDGHHGCGEDAAPTVDSPPSDQTIQRTHSLANGAYLEGELDAPANTTIMASFSTDGEAVDWNVHTHAGGSTQVLLNGTHSSHSFSFTTGEAGAYWIEWDNSTDTTISLDITITLPNGATWTGWHE